MYMYVFMSCVYVLCLCPMLMSCECPVVMFCVCPGFMSCVCPMFMSCVCTVCMSCVCPVFMSCVYVLCIRPVNCLRPFVVVTGHRSLHCASETFLILYIFYKLLFYNFVFKHVDNARQQQSDRTSKMA